ncbi:MAG TPA: DUF4249 family protein [Bacteroidales bacterium]|nr:DUF4249 family protein [Bacteroidales bacterium]HQI70120.1 DUF4249 family protein [Bacteroidales bacterium]
MKKTILYLLLLGLVSCEKQVDWPVQNDGTAYVVVDGILTNEAKAHPIRLTRSVSALNMPPEAVSGAGVIVSNADSSWFLTEQPGNPGVYCTPANFSAKVGVLYTLLVSIDGSVYTAKSRMVPNTPLILARYARSASENLFRITWVANAYNAAHPAMYELLLDWSQVPGYESLDPDNCRARLFYYSLPTIDVSQVFAPEMEKVLFPAGTKIIERKYSLNPEYVEFLRALISETNWKGGLFDSAPANVPTNLSSGATGFFAACHVITDSLIVQ